MKRLKWTLFFVLVVSSQAGTSLNRINGNDYNPEVLNFKIQPNQTTETTAILAWYDDPHTPLFYYFVAVVQNQDGDEVTRSKNYWNVAPPRYKSTLLKGFEPGHRYSVVIHVYDSDETPSLLNVKVNFCTRPSSTAGITLESFTETSFGITWDYNTSNVFSTLVVTLTPSQQIPDDVFVNCPGQQHGVCTLPRNDSVKYLHVLNLTPGTLYNVSIYTSACDSGPHSVTNQARSYTVPALPEFIVEDSGAGIKESSVKVKWAGKDDKKAEEFHEWHAVLRYNSSTIVKDESFKNDISEGTIHGLSSATKYTLEFYTTVPGQQSITSPKFLFYTRPSDVPAANVEAVHEINLTVSIPGQADNGDVFFRVIVTSNDNYHDYRNVTNDMRSVTVTGLTAATNYTITVYAVLKKNDGTLLQSSNAFVTWSFSGPPPPVHVTIDKIEGDTLTFTPSVNITQNITVDVSYKAITDSSSTGKKTFNPGPIKLVNLTMGTLYRILIYTKLIQTAKPNIIRSDRSYEVIMYTRPPAITDATIHVTSTKTDSLTIQWNAPTMGDVSNYQYNGTFSCTSPNDDRQTTTQPISLTNKYTATATRLDPGSNCSVVILTLIGGLVSDDSYQILTQKTDETAPGQVRIVNIASEAATEAAVVWKDPSKRNGVIRRYEIRIPKYKADTCEPGNPYDEKEIKCYRTIVFNCRNCVPIKTALPNTTTHENISACDSIEVGESFFKGETDFSHTIAGLHAYMNYSIEIAAYTFTRGSSDKQTVETTESTPGVPMNVHGDSNNSSALTLHWEAPACGQRNGVLRVYTITYKYRNDTVCVDQDGAGEITLNVSGIEDTARTLFGLKPFWNYSLSVVASTNKGSGELSGATTVTTLEDAPGKVRGIKSLSETAESLQLSWSQPCFPNGIITNYTIQLNNTDTGGKMATYYSGTATSVNLTGLLPYRNYTVTILADTAGRAGMKSEQIQQRTAVGEPHAPSGVVGDVISHSEVEVSWNNTFYTGPTRYVAFVATQSHLKCQTGTDYMASSCTIGGLKPYTNYTFMVTAFTSAGSVNSSESERVLTEQPVPGVVTSVGVTPEDNVTKERSLTVAWAPPKHGDRHGIIIGYAINVVTSGMDVICTTDASNKRSAKCNGAVDISCTTTKQANGDYNWACKLKNIITGDYNVTVRAKTSIGAGPSIQQPTTVEPGDTPFMGTLTEFNKRIGDTYKTWFQVDHDDGNMAPYIATTKTWNPCKAVDGSRRKRSATSKNVDFVVGKSGKCSGAPPGDRCNGELVPDKSYRVKAFACTDGGCTETKYSSLITTDALFPVAMVAMVAGGISAVLVVIAVVVATVIMKRRQMLCFRISRDEQNSNRLNMPVSSSEMKNISVSRNGQVFKPGPVNLSEFPAYVQGFHMDNNRLFAEAFTMLKTESPLHSSTVAKQQRNKQKNRFINILAYDHSRVKLFPINGGEESDYINANYIPGYSSAREYIATQGPLVATINDFWRMVWEQNADTLVMLSNLNEKGRNKSVRYWPERNESLYFGDLEVCAQSESHFSDYSIRTLEVKQISSRRLVHQFSYLGWPETGCPDNPTQMLEFVKSVQEHSNVNSKRAPILVHCGTGVGRTGTFIAIDYLMKYIRDHDEIDIYKRVLEMRNYRCSMVQTEEQYAFIYDCLKEVTTKDGVEYETHYQSLRPDRCTSDHVYDSPNFNTGL